MRTHPENCHSHQGEDVNDTMNTSTEKWCLEAWWLNCNLIFIQWSGVVLYTSERWTLRLNVQILDRGIFPLRINIRNWFHPYSMWEWSIALTTSMFVKHGWFSQIILVVQSIIYTSLCFHFHIQEKDVWDQGAIFFQNRFKAAEWADVGKTICPSISSYQSMLKVIGNKLPNLL